MTSLLHEITCEPTTQYGVFLISGGGGDEPDLGSSTGWLFATGDYVVVRSASGVWNAPDALLQSWDGEPPHPGPRWSTVQTTAAVFSHSVATVHNLMHDVEFARLPLPTPGRYRVRGYTGDRHQLRAALERADHHAARTDPPAPVRGVEHHLLQFWPDPETTDAPQSIALDYEQEQVRRALRRQRGTGP
ncbi:hypothetical protein [Amycolatopsis sp. NPDC049868]|uniref:hypothetical protein n=1 Tax=Amycolatopsis sp. NPDC049868 TaxID=3363934 RepID=UPI00379ABEC1